MTRLGLEDCILYAQRELKTMLELQQRSNCTTCAHCHFCECTLYKSRIPDDFAKVGCDKWEHDDDIPF